MKRAALGLLLALFVIAAPSAATAQDGCPNGASEWAYPACDDGNPIDGYWWWGETWVPGYIRVVTQFVELPVVFRGRGVWYAPGVMEATAEVRGLSLEGYLDGVASMSCADIGQPYWLSRFPYDRWEGPFLVVDCPQLDDVYGVIVGREEAVEVGWSTVERWADGSPPSGGWEMMVSRVYPVVDPLDAPNGPGPELAEWFPPQAEYYPMVLELTLDRRPLYRNHDGVVTWRINGVWHTFSSPEVWPSEARFLRPDEDYPPQHICPGGQR